MSAGATVALLLAGLTPAVAAETSLDDALVLELRLDGSLADSGPNAFEVTMQSGTESYAPGLDGGEALEFDGSGAIRLGTDAALQPQDQTTSFWYKPTGPTAAERPSRATSR
ncbi:hypothetical protein [Myceligenerans indicum]|uniref:Uncharacterized protein n=1 Tax=Myceligenerans indicum TaxID=2593663 RepID=A0ABS1LMU4_9MICO|nr:hypothetical protein [Myceligenerans indicum]MBL0887595.1 hypothetical protein [Myceligenerans indicum]